MSRVTVLKFGGRRVGRTRLLTCDTCGDEKPAAEFATHDICHDCFHGLGKPTRPTVSGTWLLIALVVLFWAICIGIAFTV